MGVRSLIRFSVKPGRESDFEAAFEASGMLTRPLAIEGFLRAELLRSRATPAEYYVIGQWDSAEAYASWQKASLVGADARVTAGLLDTLVDPKPGRLFDVIASSGPARTSR